ncbi:Enoyl-CoA hydratase/isomerase [Patulibacter medicamentivorans]|uniref:Enoyl-CoA hydratase/isomerase n=1 Tax=Patulibacter medicamentivorans TaxID=1097667 RepID=H0EAI5_9ACTN|nr:enoyl-CoA hydratase/isomerase family protein [Patulibacter medicamentivorans]EHN09312.1 Enoyl-CoA hydratase/isomerase [Patulibacter medicamentivorans]
MTETSALDARRDQLPNAADGTARPAVDATPPWPIEVVDGVAVTTMTGTPANCQNEAFYAALHATLDRLDDEHRDRPVVLTGEGRSFSAGLDVRYVGELFRDGDHDALLAWKDRYFATNLRLFALDRPLVAAVNGHAYAGGLITALCADLRIGARGPARFALNEVPIGIPMPRTYLELLASAIGWPTASRLSLLGTELDVEAAHRIGVLDEVCDPAALVSRAIAEAARLAGGSLPAFRFTKRAVRAPVLGRMHEAAAGADRAFVDVVRSPESRRAIERLLATLDARATGTTCSR